MKVYVDELPKSCNDCKFRVYIAHYQNGWEHSERYCSIVKDSYDCKCSKERCPLQSLAEHDKQVRKQVCDELKQKLKEHLIDWYEDEENVNKELYIDSDWVWEVLDQIEKGE